jgi:hypothetical protein
VQVGDEKLPPESELKLTVPVGVMAPPTSESVTVTVHVVLVPGRAEEGEHDTDTVTDLNVAVIPNGDAELGVWSTSPPYEADTEIAPSLPEEGV